MFGMLDYRAHKLYLMIFGIPNFLLVLFSLFGLPFVYYGLGHNYADSHTMVIVYSLIAWLIIEIIWGIFVHYLSKFYIFIFGLFVDVIPADGRSEDEAKLVIWNGEKAIRLINFNKKKPKDWTDEDFDKLYTGFFNFFYKESIILRCEKIQDYYVKNPKIIPNEWNTNKFLKEQNLEIGILEKIVTNPFFRACAIRYSIFLYLISFNPFS
jgi:hypothetical protein